MLKVRLWGVCSLQLDGFMAEPLRVHPYRQTHPGDRGIAAVALGVGAGWLMSLAAYAIEVLQPVTSDVLTANDA